MKKSNIKTVVHTGSKEWNGKTLEKYLVVFDNEDNGTLTVFPNGTTPTIGMELEYEIIDNGYGAEIKTPKKSGGGGGFAKWTPEQVAQQDAIKLTCSYIDGRGDISKWKEFFADARAFMLETIKTNTAPIEPPVAQQEQGTTDDLPF